MKSILALARVSFKELIHDRVIYNILIAFILIFLSSIVLAQLAVQKIEIFQIGFSLTAQQWIQSLMAIMIGSSALNREFQRKSYFLIKIRPISTLQILIGKTLGAFLFLFITSILFSALNGFLLRTLSGTPHLQFYWAHLLTAFESIPILTIAIVISTQSSTAVSIGISAAIVIVGNSLSTLAMVSNRSNNLLMNTINSFSQLIFPQLELFHLNASAMYELPIAKMYPFSVIVYAVLYSMAWLILGSILLRNKKV